jgi:hypothetical protein
MMQQSAAAPVLAIFLSGVQSARVYTWREPHSGVRRISNVAPSWYRPYAKVIEPRVMVTLDGALIDDTSWPLIWRLKAARRRQPPTTPRR